MILDTPVKVVRFICIIFNKHFHGMRYYSVFIFLVAWTFVSCRQEKRSTPEIKQDSSEGTTDSQPRDRIYKGLFVVGRNMHSFRNCRDTENNYWIEDSTHQMDELYKTMFLNSPAFPYEYVYVEVRGVTGMANEQASAKGFDSTLTVKEILTFEQKNYRNTCIPYDFWALGDVPNWSLQVSQKEGILALKDFTDGQVYLFEYFSPKVVNDEVFTYNSNNYANQTAISAVFKKEQCSDATSKNEYLFSASVVVNGKRFEGCAIKGLEQ